MSSLVNLLKKGNFSKFVQIKSNQELIEEFLNKSTQNQDQSDNKEISYIASDLFSSLTKEGMSVYEILKYLSNQYKDKTKIIDIFKTIKENNDIVIFYDKSLSFTKKEGDPINNNDSKVKKDPANILVSHIDVKKIIPSFKDDKTNGHIKSIDDVGSHPNRVNSPGFAIILHNKREYRAGSKNSLELQVFTSLLNNVEMSKCYPYFDAKFFLPSVVNDKNTEFKEFDTGSITNYLFGTLNNSQKTQLFNNFNKKIEKQQKDITIKGQVGNMSLFTAPQTMNNFNESYGLSSNVLNIDPSIKDKRLTTVHDIARPFMTFKNFSIDVAPTKGLMSFKTGRMSLVLHDRTRLNEVSPFIKPELFGPFGAEIDVEYGWKHIQGTDFNEVGYKAENSKNIIADYIHNSRIKEKYIITNSSFNIDQSGQVNIDLNLSMKGPIIFKHAKITSEPGIDKELKELEAAHIALVEAIKEANAIKKKKEVKIEYKRNDQVSLIFGNNTVASFSDKQKEEIKKIKSFYRIPDSDKQNLSISRRRGKSTEINKFFGLSKVDKANAEKINKNVDDLVKHILLLEIAVDNRVEKIKGKVDSFKFKTIKADQAFFAKDNKWSQNVATLNKATKNKYQMFEKISKNSFYTLGNILTTLIHQNFINQSASQFDEVQIVFYNLNESCGLGAGINISNILIHKEELDTFITDIFTNNITLTLEGFLTNIIKETVQTEKNYTYGINGFYVKTQKKPKGGQQKKKQESAAEYAKRINSINDVLSDIYKAIKIENYNHPEINNDVNIVMPSIHLSFDAFPMKDENKTICRISVYDRNDNPFGTLHKIYEKSLNQKGNNNLFAVSKEIRFLINQIKNKADNDSFIERLKKKIIMLIEKDYIVKDGENGIIVNANLGFDYEIKDALKELMPSLIFGQENSPMLEASVSSINDAKFDTVIMTRSGNKMGKAIEAKFNEKLPLNVKPTQAQVTMIGCPFVNFAQNIFLDFNTGTTIDNRYNVTGLKHDIVPGKFTTSLTLSYGEAFGKYETAVNNIAEGFLKSKSENNDDDDPIEKAFKEQETRKNQKTTPPPADIPVIDNIVKDTKKKLYTIKIKEDSKFDLDIEGKYELEAKVEYYDYINTDHKIKFNKQNKNMLKSHTQFYSEKSDVKSYYIDNILNSKKVSKDFTKIFSGENEYIITKNNFLEKDKIKLDLLLIFKIKEDLVLSPSLKIVKNANSAKNEISLVNEASEEIYEKMRQIFYNNLTAKASNGDEIKLDKELEDNHIMIKKINNDDIKLNPGKFKIDLDKLYKEILGDIFIIGEIKEKNKV